MGYLTLLNFFKLHHVLVHFPLAIALMVHLIPEREGDKLRWYLFLVYLGFAIALCSTGLGLAITQLDAGRLPWIHGVAGISVFLSSVYIYLHVKKVVKGTSISLLALTVLAVCSGTVQAFGLHYFTEPTEYSAKNLEGKEITNESLLTFHKNIRPILDRKCVKCHNANLQNGGLDTLPSLESVTTKKFYYPKYPHKSSFFNNINQGVKSNRHMPAFSGNLSNDEIAKVREWITSGGLEYTIKKEDDKNEVAKKIPWEFQPFKKPDVPKLSRDELFKNEIDYFLLDGIDLKSAEWKKIDDATLWNRLTLTLTGLRFRESKPFTQSIESNFQDQVTVLLNSRGFYSNFSTYWFDISGFADEPGFEQAQIFRTSKGYRKFVYNAIKADMPYFEFLKQQIPTGLENKSEDRNYKLLTNQLTHVNDPYDTLDIGINVLFSMNLGVEMKCARCHDHKILPITNEEYYSILKILAPAYGINRDEARGYRLRMKAGRPIKESLLNVFTSIKQELPMLIAQRPAGFTNSKINILISYDLATWFTDTKHGVGFFTARSYVDKVWKYVFGSGILPEAGATGLSMEPPKKIDLLNWLTYDFIEHGGSLKYLLNKIVSSNAFRSGTILDPQEEPINFFSRRHISAENMRDNFLFSAGLLNHEWEPGAPNEKDIFEVRNKRDELNFRKSRFYLEDLNEYFNDPHDKKNKRGTHFIRKRPNENVNGFKAAFGFVQSFDSEPGRPLPQLPSEFLFYIRDPFLKGLIEGLSERYLLKFPEYSDGVIVFAYRNILFREATEQERNLWRDFFKTKDDYRKNLKIFIHVLFSSTEFSYIP